MSLQKRVLTAPLRQEHTGPNVGHLKRLGRLGRVREQICSAVLEAFGTVWTVSGQIQLESLSAI